MEKAKHILLAVGAFLVFALLVNVVALVVVGGLSGAETQADVPENWTVARQWTVVVLAAIGAWAVYRKMRA